LSPKGQDFLMEGSSEKPVGLGKISSGCGQMVPGDRPKISQREAAGAFSRYAGEPPGTLWQEGPVTAWQPVAEEPDTALDACGPGTARRLGGQKTRNPEDREAGSRTSKIGQLGRFFGRASSIWERHRRFFSISIRTHPRNAKPTGHALCR